MLEKLKSLRPGGKNSGSSTEHVVALDIGTENVKALIGRIKGDNIEIIGIVTIDP